jgi:hypothetical protein
VRGVNEFLSVLSTFVTFMKVSAGKTVLFLWMSVKVIYICTVKPYDTLKVKGDMVKSVYYVMEYPICSLVTCVMRCNYTKFSAC